MARVTKVGKGNVPARKSSVPKTAGTKGKTGGGPARGSTVSGGKKSQKRPVTKTGRNPRPTRRSY